MGRSMVLVLALFMPLVARAEPKDDARRHFRLALEAVEQEDYAVALQHFLAAQAAYPHPATLYNIARTYTDLNDFKNALTYYRLYRDASPEDDKVDAVMAAVEARADAGAPELPPTGPAGASPPAVVSADELTETERAQLQGLATELEALSEVFDGRGQATAAGNTRVAAQATKAAAGLAPSLADAAAPGAPGGPEGGLGPAPTVPEGELDLGEGGFLTDAYERVVVTASRYGQDPLDSPSTLSVLTAEDIRLSGVTNIPDLLRRSVGVDVMELTGGHHDISIRSFNRELNNKVIVLIDGRSTYWDFVGATLWSTLPIVLEEIERIEIIRGPGSSIYGANAVTGVVNIITKLPGEVTETRVTADAGTIGMRRGSAYTSGRVGPHSYRFSAGYDEHGRWEKDYELDPDGPLVPYFEDQDLGLRSFKAHGRIDRTFGRLGFASLSGGYNGSKFEYYSLGSLGNFGLENSSHYVRGDLAWDPLHLRVFWNSDAAASGPWLNWKGTLWANNTPIDNDVVDVEVEAPSEATTGIVEHRFNLGVSYRHKRIQLDYLEGGFDRVYNEDHFAAFLHEEATIGKLKLVGSFRVDRHPLIDNLTRTMSPRGAAILRVADATSIRVTGGTAFRAPNSVESYTDYELPSPYEAVYITVPGQDQLQPERIATIEAGVHDESTNFHVADLAVYYNRLTNVVWLPSVTQETHQFSEIDGGFQGGWTGWFNSDDPYTGMGVEAELRFFPLDGMDVFANVDVQTVTVPEVTAQRVGSEAPVPNFGLPSNLKLNGGWMYRTPIRTDLTLMAHYLSSQTWPLNEFDENGILSAEEQAIPARFILSARVGVRPTKGENLELALTGWNLAAGDGFQEHIKGQLVRTRIHGTVSYKF